MNIKEKIAALSINQRAALYTALIVMCPIVLFLGAATVPWILFPAILVGLAGCLIYVYVYVLYRSIRDHLECREKWRK